MPKAEIESSQEQVIPREHTVVALAENVVKEFQRRLESGTLDKLDPTTIIKTTEEVAAQEKPQSKSGQPAESGSFALQDRVISSEGRSSSRENGTTTASSPNVTVPLTGAIAATRMVAVSQEHAEASSSSTTPTPTSSTATQRKVSAGQGKKGAKVTTTAADNAAASPGETASHANASTGSPEDKPATNSASKDETPQARKTTSAPAAALEQLDTASLTTETSQPVAASPTSTEVTLPPDDDGPPSAKKGRREDCIVQGSECSYGVEGGLVTESLELPRFNYTPDCMPGRNDVLGLVLAQIINQIEDVLANDTAAEGQANTGRGGAINRGGGIATADECPTASRPGDNDSQCQCHQTTTAQSLGQLLAGNTITPIVISRIDRRPRRSGENSNANPDCSDNEQSHGSLCWGHVVDCESSEACRTNDSTVTIRGDTTPSPGGENITEDNNTQQDPDLSAMSTPNERIIIIIELSDSDMQQALASNPAVTADPNSAATDGQAAASTNELLQPTTNGTSQTPTGPTIVSLLDEPQTRFQRLLRAAQNSNQEAVSTSNPQRSQIRRPRMRESSDTSSGRFRRRHPRNELSTNGRTPAAIEGISNEAPLNTQTRNKQKRKLSSDQGGSQTRSTDGEKSVEKKRKRSRG